MDVIDLDDDAGLQKKFETARESTGTDADQDLESSDDTVPKAGEKLMVKDWLDSKWHKAKVNIVT